MIETIKVIPGGDNEGTIPVDLYMDKKTNKVLLFVGGSNDDRETWLKVVEALQNAEIGYSYACFSFSGIEDGRRYWIRQQILDLESVVELLVDRKFYNITVFATSMGAASTSWLVSISKFRKYIERLILLDPADYKLVPNLFLDDVHTYDGGKIYDPKTSTFSQLLIGTPKYIKVDVVRLTLRNRTKQGYIYKDSMKRGIDVPTGFPRLNQEMVRSFYNNLPDECRGKYMEISDLPHAFNRDGDIDKNYLRLISLLTELL